MTKLSHGRVIGIDVSRDWLDLYYLPGGLRRRVPNRPEGHEAIANLARDKDAVVCFEATGGQEWQLWATLEAEGVVARQVPPAQSEPLMRHWFKHNGERLCTKSRHARKDR